MNNIEARIRHLAVAIGLPSAGRRTAADEQRWSEELRNIADALKAAQGGVTEAMWQAVDRMIVDAWKLGGCEKSLDMLAMRQRYDDAALEAALSAQQGQGEAVAWRVPIAGWFEYFRTEDQARAARAEYEGDHEIDIESEDHAEPEPLYTAPPAQPANSYRAAYEGAREDLLDWKGRAQRAEATLRSLGYAGVTASEPPARVPEGWVLVPREPTEAMLEAAMQREDDEPLSDWGKVKPASHAEIYKAMLAASPAPAAQGQPGGDGGEG